MTDRPPEVGLLLGPAYHRLRTLIEEGLAAAGLDGLVEPGMGPLLFLLETLGEQPIHELVRRTGLTKATVTNQLLVMTRKGLVLRRSDRVDHRVVLVRLSATGRRVMPALHVLRRQIDQTLRACLGADAEACARGLAHIVALEPAPVSEDAPAPRPRRRRPGSETAG